MSSSWQQQQRYMTKNHILFFVFWRMFSKLSSFGSVGGVFIKYFAPLTQHTFTQAKQQKKKLFLSTHNSDHKTLLTTLNKKKLTNSEKKYFTTSKLFLFLPLFLCFSYSQKNGNFMCCKFTSSDKEFITLANSWTLLGSTLDLPSLCMLAPSLYGSLRKKQECSFVEGSEKWCTKKKGARSSSCHRRKRCTHHVRGVMYRVEKFAKVFWDIEICQHLSPFPASGARSHVTHSYPKIVKFTLHKIYVDFFFC